MSSGPRVQDIRSPPSYDGRAETKGSGALPAAGALGARNEPLTAIRGVRVGHAHDARRRSGTTVVLFDRPSMSFADHRGGWPGSYDTAGAGPRKKFVGDQALFLPRGGGHGGDGVGGMRR